MYGVPPMKAVFGKLADRVLSRLGLGLALERHRYDAAAALRIIFGGEIPRVVQGVRA